MTQLQQLLDQVMIRGYERSPKQTFNTALDRIFDSSDETRLQKARRIMAGDIAKISGEDLEVYLTEFQYLIDEWCDAYERHVFQGSTLKQLLGQA